MFDSILVPLDGSETAEAALAYAALLPSRHVRLLAVEHARKDLTAVCKTTRDCEAYLERVAAPLRQCGRDVETTVAHGAPAERIMAFAATANLVVMGSHGRGVVERCVLGSVADQVARHAPVPTLIVREGQGTQAIAHVMRLVVPLDGSTLAEQAVPVAAGLASDLGVPIHLVRVLDVDPVRAAVQAGVAAASASMRSHEVDRRLAEKYLTDWVQNLQDQDLAVSAEVRLGNTAAMLLETIRPEDLVVMTSHGLGGVRRWFLGSVAETLVRAAAAPVLLVPAPAHDPLSSAVTDGSLPVRAL